MPERKPGSRWSGIPMARARPARVILPPREAMVSKNLVIRSLLAVTRAASPCRCLNKGLANNWRLIVDDGAGAREESFSTLGKPEGSGPRLIPLFLALRELIPWLLQWFNDLDPVYAVRLGDYYREFLDEQLRVEGLGHGDLDQWLPPTKKKRRKKSAPSG